MKTFKQFLSEILHRIDAEKIQNFNKELGIYFHTKDWSSSGRLNPDKRQSVSLNREKGLFAGKMRDIAPFAVPRDVRWTQHPDDDGNSVISFDIRDKRRIQKHRPILSAFPDRGFKKLPTGEMFSQNPHNPLRQKVISNAIRFIENNGHKVQFVDGIENYKKQLKNRADLDPDFWVNSEGL
jgi:hypothetical protein